MYHRRCRKEWIDWVIDSIDTALSAGDFEKLLTICGIVDCNAPFTSCSADQSAIVKDDGNQTIRLQQPNLPDLETDLHLLHAELIADVEKSLLMMQYFLAVVVSDSCWESKWEHLNSLMLNLAHVPGKLSNHTWFNTIQMQIRRHITSVNTADLCWIKIACRTGVYSMV